MTRKDRFTTIVMTVVVWSLAGGLFGALFAGFHQVLQAEGLSGWQPPVGAAAAAAMTTSAFYSAMPVALTGAMAGVLASIGSLILLGQNIALAEITGVAAVAGLLAGSFFAWMSDSGDKPLLETLIGLGSGLIAGAALGLLVNVVGDKAGMFVLAAGVVALVGTLFQVSQRLLRDHNIAWLPGSLSAATVAALIASLVAGSMWILGDTSTFGIDTITPDALTQIKHEIPPGFLGGLTGGAVTGVILELLGFHLEDHA